MGFRSTWIMVVLVALLGGYTFYEFKNSDEDAETAKGEKRLFWIQRDDLEEFELGVHGEVTVVRKDGAGWKLIKPIEDMAETSAVEGFLFSLLTQKGKQFQSAEDEKNMKLADYGLDPVVSKVIVRGKGKTEQLDISSKNTFDGQFFIRLNGAGPVMVGDRAIAQLIERQPTSFRSRKIYRESGDVQTIQAHVDVGGMKDSYVLRRKDDKWSMDPDPGFAIDSVKTNMWMQKVQGLMPAEVAAETLSEVDRRNFLLVKPSLQVKMDSWELLVGQDKAEDTYLFTNKRPTVYKIAASNLDTVRVPKTYFRDGHPPFKFDLELVREVEIRAGKIVGTFKKGDGNWEKLVPVMQALQGFAAQEFLPTSNKGSGWPANPQVVLKDENGKVLYSLSWGAEYTPKETYNKGYTFRFVRTSANKEILGMPKEKLDRLIDSDLIKK